MLNTKLDANWSAGTDAEGAAACNGGQSGDGAVATSPPAKGAAGRKHRVWRSENGSASTLMERMRPILSRSMAGNQPVLAATRAASGRCDFTMVNGKPVLARHRDESGAVTEFLYDHNLALMAIKLPDGTVFSRSTGEHWFKSAPNDITGTYLPYRIDHDRTTGRSVISEPSSCTEFCMSGKVTVRLRS